MITEIAIVEIVVGKEAEFEVALATAVKTILPQAKGYINFRLTRGIERTNVYTFLINWDTLEDHTIEFRNSDLFVQWRTQIGSFFLNPPQIEHWTTVFKA
ncbi:MAG: antibiotic biosynthesis monooxygenase [Actinobacteria bacterium]|nr:antibiotic biosynthesis monooxygenase [Actinomycetota bacterium]